MRPVNVYRPRVGQLQVEFTLPSAIHKLVPLFRGERQHGTLTVLAIPDQHTAGHVGHLNTCPILATLRGLAPHKFTVHVLLPLSRISFTESFGERLSIFK